MRREPVASSSLKAVGYDPTTQVLEIEFQNGGVYQYDEVPRSVYADLIAAPSLGQYFQEHIRGAYRYHRLVAAD